MGALFSKKPRAKKKVEESKMVNEHDRAVLELKNARDKLQRYRKKLDIESVQLSRQAAELVKQGRKDRALITLKIKKFKIANAEKADAQLFTVKKMIDTVEWEKEQTAVVEALKVGRDALQALHAQMPLDEVQALMDDTAEALEYEAEVSRILAGAFSAGDDDSLESEFKTIEDGIEAEELTKLHGELPKAPERRPIVTTVTIPEPPTGDITATEIQPKLREAVPI